MELFDSQQTAQYRPLAARMRPTNIDEYTGQEHIIGQGRLLRRAIQADQLSSIIFYGPPGTGKTTLARVIANTTKSHFVTLNAVLSGVKELRTIIDEAKERRALYDRKTILFIDEVHRWNKSQQDALLPWVENGTLILIGATTENPFFEVNKALVSRSRIFQLKPLEREHLKKILHSTLRDKTRGYGNKKISIDPEAKEHLIKVANGDARSLLNALELAVETTTVNDSGAIHITLEIAEESIQTKAVLYDKEGDYHFDVISAFIKSLRGSDPDAALYWLGKMIYAGESPRFIFRRMLIFASEDIGLADPNAIVVVEAAASAFDRMGMPEGRFPITQAALYLATAPKSNSTMAFFDVLEAVKKEKEGNVPNHLKDASRDSEAFGHQEGYLYPHAYRNHWVAQQYLPGPLQGKVFYQPSNMGYEAQIKEEVERRREIQLALITEKEEDEILTFSPQNKKTEMWMKRLIHTENPILEEIRREIYEGVRISRHSRILDINTGSGLLLWEALRRVPEGGVWCLCSEERNRTIIEHYIEKLKDIEKPHIIPVALHQFLKTKDQFVDKGITFEVIQGRNIFTREEDKYKLFVNLHKQLSPRGKLITGDLIPRESTRLSQLISSPEKELLIEAEKQIYEAHDNCLVNWEEQDLLDYGKQAGFIIVKNRKVTYEERKILSLPDLDRWFSEQGAYGKVLAKKNENHPNLVAAVKAKLGEKELNWNRTFLYLEVHKQE